MEKVIIASNNMNKIREFSEMLGKDVQVKIGRAHV